MNDDDVALVAEFGEERGAAFGVRFERGEGGGCFVGDGLAVFG